MSPLLSFAAAAHRSIFHPPTGWLDWFPPSRSPIVLHCICSSPVLARRKSIARCRVNRSFRFISHLLAHSSDILPPTMSLCPLHPASRLPFVMAHATHRTPSPPPPPLCHDLAVPSFLSAVTSPAARSFDYLVSHPCYSSSLFPARGAPSPISFHLNARTTSGAVLCSTDSFHLAVPFTPLPALPLTPLLHFYARAACPCRSSHPHPILEPSAASPL